MFRGFVILSYEFGINGTSPGGTISVFVIGRENFLVFSARVRMRKEASSRVKMKFIMECESMQCGFIEGAGEQN